MRFVVTVVLAFVAIAVLVTVAGILVLFWFAS